MRWFWGCRTAHPRSLPHTVVTTRAKALVWSLCVPVSAGLVKDVTLI